MRKVNDNVAATARSVDRANQTMETGFARAGSAVRGMAVGLASLAAGVGIAGLVRMARSALDTADALADLHDQTGLSVEAIQAFQRHATLSGSSADAFNSGLLNLVRGVGQLQADTGRLNAQLEHLDPTLRRQLQTVHTQEQALDAVADAMQRAGSEAQQQAIAVAVFGDAGRDLAVAFREGSEGLEQAREASRRMGEVSTEAAKAAQEANDQLDKLAMTIGTSLTQAFVAAAGH
jgi:methyl-accepting chemotaxis protein